MITDTQLAAILPYYKNKARAAIVDHAIPTLLAAQAAGLWPKGESRKVKALLNKTHRALTAAAAQGARMLEEVRGSRYAYIDVEHGRFEVAPAHLELITARRLVWRDTAESQAFLDWCKAFAPVATLCRALDDARPLPSYVFAKVSPTVHRNVAEAMGIAFSSVSAPVVDYVEVEREWRGERVKVWLPVIRWPEGTRHNLSKFCWGSRAGNSQCEACGHAIRNSRNWVPLLVTVDGAPASLWVGSDCAATLFGAKIVGEADWADVRAASK